jgi:CDP-diacylglycerol--serine O-phosphatidyltransferase
MNFLANLLTLLSLLCGFFSIIFSLESHFTFASWAIILSVVFDGVDGEIARKNPIPSEFGKELDSLVDVISFGIAPSILGYIFVYRNFYLVATLSLFMYLLASVMRLVKYNITSKEKLVDYFYGVPTTVSGGVLASFILIYRKGKDLSPLPQSIHTVFLILVLALALLMVSRVRYLNLSGLKRLFGRKIRLAVLALIIIIISAAFLRKAGTVIFSLFLIYLLFSPFVIKKSNSHC